MKKKAIECRMRARTRVIALQRAFIIFPPPDMIYGADKRDDLAVKYVAFFICRFYFELPPGDRSPGDTTADDTEGQEDMQKDIHTSIFFDDLTYDAQKHILSYHPWKLYSCNNAVTFCEKSIILLLLLFQICPRIVLDLHEILCRNFKNLLPISHNSQNLFILVHRTMVTLKRRVS